MKVEDDRQEDSLIDPSKFTVKELVKKLYAENQEVRTELKEINKTLKMLEADLNTRKGWYAAAAAGIGFLSSWLHNLITNN